MSKRKTDHGYLFLFFFFVPAYSPGHSVAQNRRFLTKPLVRIFVSFETSIIF